MELDESEMVAEFQTCPYCSRTAAHEGHFLVAGRLEVPTPYGSFAIVMLVCVHSIPEERVESFHPYPFFVPWEVFKQSVERFTVARDEVMSKFGDETLKFLSDLEMRFDGEGD